MRAAIQRQCATLVENFNPLPRTAPTPVNIFRLEQELINFPDRKFVADLIYSFKYGFDIGYSGPGFDNIAQNLKSAESHSSVLFDNILCELEAKRLAGPFRQPPLKNFRTSPIGVVPKKDSGKYRTITNLSSPMGVSINDFIADSESHVIFNHFDKAVRFVAELGPNALLAKLDIKSAFRICPVRRSDWNLLGFTFQDLIFVDLCLPFGLRSSVNRFNRLASSVLWILQNNYKITYATHYLDDYLIAGPANSPTCQINMNTTISLFHDLGIPLAPEKVVGPSSSIVYLGIEIDSACMELRLPEDKLSSLLDLILAFSKKKKCTKRELLSLIGKLSFAAKVIPSGRTFTRRLIDLSTSVSKLSHHISLTSEARKDIEWWGSFLPTWNGKYKILDLKTTPCPSLNLFTDASGAHGFGIYFDRRWISRQWPDWADNLSIQWKELFPIYLSCFVWAELFHKKRLLFHCDNMSVVDIWNSQISRCPHIMSLLRKLFFITAKFNFTVNVTHIRGTDNSIADSLSRFQYNRFRALAPTADRSQTLIPCAAWQGCY